MFLDEGDGDVNGLLELPLLAQLPARPSVSCTARAAGEWGFKVEVVRDDLAWARREGVPQGEPYRPYGPLQALFSPPGRLSCDSWEIA